MRYHHINTSLIFFLMLMLCACEEQDVPEEKADDSDWIRLEIPEADEAYAVFGDIDHTLAVTTAGKAYYSTDRGKTWQMSRDFQGVVYGLHYVDDTLFALHASGRNDLGDATASLPQHYSLDSGKVWHNYKGLRQYDLRVVVSVDTTSNGDIYKLEEHIADNGYVNPSEVLKIKSTGPTTLDFPPRHNLHSLYLDASNRLYIAASGDRHNPEDNTLFCCYDALVYVSRQPSP